MDGQLSRKSATKVARHTQHIFLSGRGWLDLSARGPEIKPGYIRERALRFGQNGHAEAKSSGAFGAVRVWLVAATQAGVAQANFERQPEGPDRVFLETHPCPGCQACGPFAMQVQGW